jgi:uncharacterized protein
MQIAIISDVHDNLTNLEKFLSWSEKNKIDQIICCGDLCSLDTLNFLASGFEKPIHAVFGNACYHQEIEESETQKFSQVQHYGEIGEFEIDQKKVAVTHRPPPARKLAESGQYDFVFYGHNHRPWLEQVGSTILANPGTLAGMFYKASFAIWDTSTGKLELKLLENI